MADPRQGRAGQASYSPRLGLRDPRLRTNQDAALTDHGLDSKSVGTDGAGRQRISAADELKFLSSKAPPVAETADTSQLTTRQGMLALRKTMNELLAKLKGVR